MRATAAEPSPLTEALIVRQRDKCPDCAFGLIDPPALTGERPLYEERTAQYEAGKLRFCDCAAGQRVASFYAERSANPYGQQLAAEAAQRRRSYLESIDGLNPSERAMTLATYRVGRHNKAAVEAVSTGIEKGAGLITLTGEYGVGKSSLLMVAVNECKSKDWTSIYTTIANMLDWLRAGFDQWENNNEDFTFQRRLRLLATCQCLCLDEGTGVNLKPWGEEQLRKMVDERWRSMSTHLTIFALNGEISRFTGDVQSRLSDRRAKLIPIGGVDMRRVYRGD